MKETIYLDNNATTKLDPQVLEAMMPFLTNCYGNASSNHEFGVSISKHVKESRATIAELIKCDVNEIVFTSGATESINLAIKGLAGSSIEKGRHIVTVQTEHPAVLDTCKRLEKKGYEITYLPVKSDGIVDLEVVKRCVRDDTVLVCVMLVNNEIGVIQPINDIASISHSKGAIFMTDATQAVGKIPIDVNELGIDLMSFSGHKFYGPKGIGCLFVKGKRPFKVKLDPIIHGGGQENGLRSGTLNVPGIIGLAKACEISRSQLSKDAKKIGLLRNRLETSILSIDGTFINGNPESRIYNTSSICFNNADADAIMVGLKSISVSNGSACSSSSIEPSHVLTALGKTDKEAFSTIRFSLGRFTTDLEITETIRQVTKTVAELREMIE